MSDEALKAKEHGNTAYKKRDFAAAHGHYDEAIRLSPREITFYSNKGAAFMEEGKYEDCIAVCLKAVDIGLEKKVQFATAMARVGNAYAKMGNASEALVWYKKSLAEHHNEPMVKKIASMTEHLQKTVNAEVPTPCRVPRKFLRRVYITEMFYPLLQCPDTLRLGQRCKSVVYSSPMITKDFLEFMNYYGVEPNPEHIHFRGKKDSPVTSFDKKWKFFSWITPFIRSLGLVTSPPPSYLDSILNKDRRFLYEVHYTCLESASGAVLAFVRRQLPHLTVLFGPPSFFQLIPFGSNKKFQDVSIEAPSFDDFLSIFASKRFAASRIVLMCDMICWSRLITLNDVMSFLEHSSLRMPETNEIAIELRISDNFIPIRRFIRALRTVFPGLTNIGISFVFLNKRQLLVDFGKLEAAYDRCKSEIAMLPDKLFVCVSVKEHIGYNDIRLMEAEFSRRLISPVFTYRGAEDFTNFVTLPCGSVYRNYTEKIGNQNLLDYEFSFSIVSS